MRCTVKKILEFLLKVVFWPFVGLMWVLEKTKTNGCVVRGLVLIIYIIIAGALGWLEVTLLLSFLR
jgi:hypothetical protein